MTTKKLTVTVTAEFYEELEAAAERDSFLSVQEFVRFVLKGAVRGEQKPLNGERKPGRPVKEKKSEYEEDVEWFFTHQDTGRECAGSGSVVAHLSEYGKYPGGNCAVCGQGVWGKLVDGVDGGVELRRHKDGKEELGAVELYGVVTEREKHDRDLVGESERKGNFTYGWA